MDLDLKFKIKKYFLGLAAAALFLLIAIVIIAINGLNETSTNASIANEIAAKSYHLQSMQLSFEKTRRLSSSLFVSAGDLERIDYITTEIFSNRDIFDISANHFIRIMPQRQPHAQQAEELGRIKHISDLIEDYNRNLMLMTEFAFINDTEAINALLLETSPLVSEIAERLHEMSERLQAQSDEFAAYSAYRSNSVIMLFFLVSIVAIIIIIAIFIGIFFAITKMLASLSDAQYTSAYNQDQYKNDYVKGDSHLLHELERCVSDLKAVTYDLSKSAKELNRL